MRVAEQMNQLNRSDGGAGEPAGPVRCDDGSGRQLGDLHTLAGLLARPGLQPVLLAGSRDPNAKLTVMLIDQWGPAFAVKIATTEAAGRAVLAEADVLADLHGRGLGALAANIPRPVAVVDADGLPALVTTAVAGTPITVAYHEWRHTARRRSVRADLTVAGQWLHRLQRHTAGPARSVRLLHSSLDLVESRFGPQPELRDRLAPACVLLGRQSTPRTVVHGDYWFGNVLTHRGRVSGVVDWEAAEPAGEPLRDVARFAVSYCLYLDRHTRPGRRVAGHRGLRAVDWGAGVHHAVAGSGWLAEQVLDFCGRSLARLGADPACARALMLAGVADVAANADHADFAEAHLTLLSRLVRQPAVEGTKP